MNSSTICFQEAPELSFLFVSEEVDQATSNSKLTVVALVTENGQKDLGLKANEWVNLALQAVDGKGGGKAGLAQGSGSAPAQSMGLALVLSKAENYLKINVK